MKKKLIASTCALFLLACGSSSSSGSSATTAQLTLKATGDSSFRYACTPTAAMMPSGLFISCNESVGGNPTIQRTRVAFSIANFHGTDRYVLQGDSSSGLMNFEDDGGEMFGCSSAPQASGCTLDIQGAAAPAKGDVVQGSFRCEGLIGTHTKNGLIVTDHASADGSFVVPIAI